MTSEPASVLANHILHRHLDRGELGKLLDVAERRDYAAGRAIFRKGDRAASLMAVLRGRVKLSALSPGGKELVVHIIDQGQIFGEIAVLDGKPRSLNATALEDCELFVLARRDFIPFLRAHPDLCIRFMMVLCDRLRRTGEMFEDSQFLSLGPRLAKQLMRLAEVFGKPHQGVIRVDLGLSQGDLATLVGMSRESVNKHIVRWRDQGIVDFNRRELLIKRLDRLRALSAGALDLVPRALDGR